MKMKILVICPCGAKLLATMENYLKMRCPKCRLMLGVEIGRQAARNSRMVHDITAIMLNDRLKAKTWTVHDEIIVRLLCKYEIESHGGVWPPPEAVVEDDFNITMPVAPPKSSPLHVDEPVVEKRSIKVKTRKKKKGGRR